MKVKKALVTFAKRLFHVKKVIVVTDQSVDYYPIGGSAQLLMAAGIIGMVSWGSYSTGSFMAAKSQIEEKERKIEQVSEENRKIEDQFSLLKRDLMNLQQEGEDLSEYAQFVISQYENNKDGLGEMEGLPMDADLSEQKELVMERIGFLEERIDQLKHENEAFIEAIRKRTKGKISEFEDIINMTGLSSKVLELKQSRLMEEEERNLASNEESLPRGGPYEPATTYEAREKDLFAAIDQMMTLHGVIETLPLDRPMQGRYTSRFGKRVDPFTRRWARHSGLDIAAPIGTRVRAAQAGKVTFAGRRGAYGNMVEVDHGLGVATRYGHLSSIKVKEGQIVEKDDLLAIQGSTGRSTGHHLHYEVRYRGEPMNPMNFLEAGKHVSTQ